MKEGCQLTLAAYFMAFKPGQSGNPKGRPPQEQTLSKALRDIMDEETVEYQGRKITGKEACARKLFELAMKGDVTCLKYIYDRLDGSPKQAIDLDATMQNVIPDDFFTIKLIDVSHD